MSTAWPVQCFFKRYHCIGVCRKLFGELRTYEYAVTTNCLTLHTFKAKSEARNRQLSDSVFFSFVRSLFVVAVVASFYFLERAIEKERREEKRKKEEKKEANDVV